MLKSSYFVAACIGSAVGFAALDWVQGSAIALFIALLVIAVGILPAAPPGRRKEVVVTFLGQPLAIAHAIIWCTSLVLAALFVQAWG